MRCHATPGPPGLSYFGECLGIRAFTQGEGDARKFLNREIARGKRIGVTEAEQQVDVGSPWADSMQCRERCMGLIGIHVTDCGEIDTAFGYRLADLPNRFDLGRGETQALELVDASPPNCVVMKWIEGGKQPGTNCGCARRRKLLTAHNRA